MDAYQQAVEYLTANPRNIRDAWSTAMNGPTRCFPGSVLFLAAGNPNDLHCGCLTMIRDSSFFCADTRELTLAIRADSRIPKKACDIKPDHLPVFAGWQRRIDKILGRTPPAMDPRIPLPTGDIEIPLVEVNMPIEA